MYWYLSKISSEIQKLKFWMPIIQTFYIYMTKDVRILGYFLKPNGFHEQKVWGTLHWGIHVVSDVIQ